MASKTPRIPSGEARADRSTDSVFDFLYYDAPRVASYLSQFDNSGTLTSIVRGERAGRAKQTSTNMEATGSIAVAKGTVSQQREVSAEYAQDSQLVYDPTWANARAFLDYLDERQLMQRDFSVAGIGQFVLGRGELSIRDLNLMLKTWQLTSVKKLMRAAVPSPNRQDRKRGVTQITQSATDNIDFTVDILSILPHTIQANLNGDAAELWCSLPQQGLSCEASDIALKHGTHIPGEWHILGILDARPDSPHDHQSGRFDVGDGAEMVAKMMGMVAPLARTFLGRPNRCYGVTPLLVFREISG